MRIPAADFTFLSSIIEPHEFYREVEDEIEDRTFAVYDAIKRRCHVTPRRLNGTAVFPAIIEVSCTVPAHVGAAELHQALTYKFKQYELHVTK